MNYKLLPLAMLLIACAPQRQNSSVEIKLSKPSYLAEHYRAVEIKNNLGDVSQFTQEVLNDLYVSAIEDFNHLGFKAELLSDFRFIPLREKSVLIGIKNAITKTKLKIETTELSNSDRLDFKLLMDFLEIHKLSYETKLLENRLKLYNSIISPFYYIDGLLNIEDSKLKSDTTESFLKSLLRDKTYLNLTNEIQKRLQIKKISTTQDDLKSIQGIVDNPKGYREHLISKIKVGLGSNASTFTNELKQLATDFENSTTKLKKIINNKNNFNFNNTVSKSLYANILKTHGVYLTPDSMYKIANDELKKQLPLYQALIQKAANKYQLKKADASSVLNYYLNNQSIQLDSILQESVLVSNQHIEEIILAQKLMTLPSNAQEVFFAGIQGVEHPVLNMRSTHGIPQMIDSMPSVSKFPFVLWPSVKIMNKKTPDYKIAPFIHSISAHEGRPGHEMQFTSIQNIPNKSYIRHKLIMNTANVEGWALYAEKMIEEHVSSDNFERLLFYKLAYLQRVLRVITDYEITLGKITPKEGIQKYMSILGVSEKLGKSEINRRLESPGRDTGYFVGRVAIEKLKLKVEKKYSTSYTDKCFHDLVVNYSFAPAQFIEQMIDTTQNCLKSN